MRYRCRPLASLFLIACLLLPNAGCTSTDPDQARADLAQKRELAERAQDGIDQADGLVQQLQAQLDEVLAANAQLEAAALEMEAQAQRARVDEAVTADELAEIERIAAEARDQADAARGDAVLQQLRGKLNHWTTIRDTGRAQVAVALASIERQEAELEAGTGGTGIGADLQVLGEQLQAGADLAPPPAGGWLKLAGWGLGAVGLALVRREARRRKQAEGDKSAAEAQRDHEASMLNTVISSIEAAKAAGDGYKIDFIDTKTKRIIDTVQGSVPGTKQRVDAVTSKGDAPTPYSPKP
ncbi:MAG: hypothetical protein AAGC44_05305 [Planctomycetota bacterium]